MQGFETARLRGTAWTASLSGASRDGFLSELGALLSPAVLAPLPPAAQDLSAGIGAWADRQAREARGYVLRRKDSEALVGVFLVMPADAETWHIGYLLGERHWGAGYATEAVLGVLAATGSDGPKTWRAGVAIDNPASARVLEKCGFVRQGGARDADVVHFVRHMPPPV